jgi:8-oxo-dGTP pyrophosphatase MutT (NUDIX family)
VKTTRLRLTKEVSVMAWIEDSDKNILLVRQTTGLKLWTLPGGKVKRGELLVKALKREVYEETAMRVQIGSLLGVLDRWFVRNCGKEQRDSVFVTPIQSELSRIWAVLIQLPAHTSLWSSLSSASFT